MCNICINIRKLDNKDTIVAKMFLISYCNNMKKNKNNTFCHKAPFMHKMQLKVLDKLKRKRADNLNKEEFKV